MKIATSLIAVSILVAGCASPVPVAETHPLSHQKKVKAAHHWDVIAEDIAKETALLLARDGQTGQRPLFVPVPATNSAFDRAFHNFLVTRLVRLGIAVSDKQTGALEVRYETQVVQHASPREDYRPGALTGLAAGILVLRNFHTWDATEKGMGAVAAAVGLDVAGGHLTSPSQTELLVTTSLSDGSRFLLRKSDVYYIEDEDSALYRQIKEKEWKVMG